MKYKMIVGYIHVCQTGNWQKSFDMLWKEIKEHGVYDASDEIRVGVVVNGAFQPDPRLDDPKMRILFHQPCSMYERPTLLHMRDASEREDAYYWYVHTKGISHFGTSKEPFVTDWIQLLLYWNIRHWKHAVHILDSYPTYGCNSVGKHYSGNFWWATSAHVKTLPKKIGDGYIDPENWICSNNAKLFSVFNSGLQGYGHYYFIYPAKRYIHEPLTEQPIPHGYSSIPINIVSFSLLYMDMIHPLTFCLLATVLILLFFYLYL